MSDPKSVHTPEMRTVDEVAEFLGVSPAHLIKTLIFETDEEFVAVLIRGDLEVNEVKLKNELGCTHLQLATEAKIEEITGGPQGFSGPVGLEGVRIVADPTVMALEVAATGANAADAHLVGVEPGSRLRAVEGGGRPARHGRRPVSIVRQRPDRENEASRSATSSSSAPSTRKKWTAASRMPMAMTNR